jgi:hypothetical protein
MALPTRQDPKRLSDYFGGWERRHKKTPVLKPGSPTRSQIEKESAVKYKDIVRRDIDASEKRRAALEAMWQREKDEEFANRKQAIDAYKAYAEGAPDPKLDIGGEGRAAYFNTDLGKRVTNTLAAHFQASKDKADRQDPSRAENRGPTQGEFEQAKSVGEAFTGYGKKTGSGAPPAEAPAPGIEFKIEGKTVRTTGKTRMVKGKPKVEVMYKGKLFAVDPEDVPKQARKADSTDEYAGSDILKSIGGGLAAPFKTKRPFDAPGI